jgi:phenylalanyl-tRNA synthetase beta chain
MKVTYNWLKDFVDIGISPKALAEKLTMAGLEVVSLEERSGDAVFEIEITSNRPDWLGVIGIAREVAAITGKKLKKLPVKKMRAASGGYGQFVIKIEDKKDCPLYTAKIITGVKVGPSPDWLRNRLELIGCRSINNIVDVTNYVLFTYGQPLHAFDLDKLKGSAITVRRAKPAEKIVTIDGAQRILDPDILVIADAEGPVAVAGVMGSKNTEVCPTTRNILLEAASFDPAMVRKGRSRLGIQSDSSYRFERGVNIEGIDRVSGNACELIITLAGGKYAMAKDLGIARPKSKNVILDISSVKKTLGVNIPVSRIKAILEGLGFRVKTKAKDHLAIAIPAHRNDVNSGVDLIEEIARIYGYENIPPDLPMVKPQVIAQRDWDLVSSVKNILTGLGLNEVMTYSLMDKGLLRDFRVYDGIEAVEVANPLSTEQEILRPGLIPGLAVCVAHNLNQKQEYINIFEIAKTFSQGKGCLKEELNLGVALCGTRSLMLPQGLTKDPACLLHLKGILEVLFGRLGVKDYSIKINDLSGITIIAGGQQIGAAAGLDKQVLGRLDIKNKEVFMLELSLDKLRAYLNPHKKFVHLPQYPGIGRDISFVLKENIPAGDVLEAIQQAGEPLLKEAKVTDYYKGKQIPPGFRGLTVSCSYGSEDRTLTEEEIKPLHSQVCKVLTDNFGAQFR